MRDVDRRDPERGSGCAGSPRAAARAPSRRAPRAARRAAARAARSRARARARRAAACRPRAGAGSACRRGRARRARAAPRPAPRRSSCAVPRILQPELDVPLGGHVREEAVRLEDHAHVALVGRHAGHVLAGDEDPAGVRPVEAGDEPQRGRLAAPGRPEQREELALLEREARSRRARRRRRTRAAAVCSSTYAISVPLRTGAGRRRPTSSSDSIAAHVIPKLISDTAAGRVRLGLVDVLDVDREGVEGREARDRELAHHDRERQERARRARRRGCSGGSRAGASSRQLAPRLCDASVSVCTSIARKPASSAK